MMKSLGAIALRNWRKGRNLTQTEAAAHVGVDVTYYAKIERGARKPGRTVAVRMHEASEGAVHVSLWDREEFRAAS